MKADGDTYYNNGARKNVKNRGYFKKVMQGQKIMSPPIESKVDGRTKVILAVPIYRNGKVTGALGASYNVGALNQMLFNDIFAFVTQIIANNHYLQTLITASSCQEFIDLLLSYLS